MEETHEGSLDKRSLWREECQRDDNVLKLYIDGREPNIYVLPAMKGITLKRYRNHQTNLIQFGFNHQDILGTINILFRDIKNNINTLQQNFNDQTLRQLANNINQCEELLTISHEELKRLKPWWRQRTLFNTWQSQFIRAKNELRILSQLYTNKIVAQLLNDVKTQEGKFNQTTIYYGSKWEDHMGLRQAYSAPDQVNVKNALQSYLAYIPKSQTKVRQAIIDLKFFLLGDFRVGAKAKHIINKLKPLLDGKNKDPRSATKTRFKKLVGKYLLPHVTNPNSHLFRWLHKLAPDVTNRWQSQHQQGKIIEESDIVFLEQLFQEKCLCTESKEREALERISRLISNKTGYSAYYQRVIKAARSYINLNLEERDYYKDRLVIDLNNTALTIEYAKQLLLAQLGKGQQNSKFYKNILNDPFLIKSYPLVHEPIKQSTQLREYQQQIIQHIESVVSQKPFNDEAISVYYNAHFAAIINRYAAQDIQIAYQNALDQAVVAKLRSYLDDTGTLTSHNVEHFIEWMSHHFNQSFPHSKLIFNQVVELLMQSTWHPEADRLLKFFLETSDAQGELKEAMCFAYGNYQLYYVDRLLTDDTFAKAESERLALDRQFSLFDSFGKFLAQRELRHFDFKIVNFSLLNQRQLQVLLGKVRNFVETQQGQNQNIAKHLCALMYQFPTVSFLSSKERYDLVLKLNRIMGNTEPVEEVKTVKKAGRCTTLFLFFENLTGNQPNQADRKYTSRSMDLWQKEKHEQINLPEILGKIDFDEVLLDLSEKSLSDEEMPLLAEFLKTHKKIKILHLYDNKITDDGILILAEVLKTYPNHIAVDLLGNPITKQGGQVLSTLLETNEKVRLNNVAASISIPTWVDCCTEQNVRNYLRREGFCEVDNEGKSITFCATLVGNKGINLVAEYLKTHQAVEYIKLKACLIGDEGVRALSETLKTYPRPLTVDLTDNPITNKDILLEVVRENTKIAIHYDYVHENRSLKF